MAPNSAHALKTISTKGHEDLTVRPDKTLDPICDHYQCRARSSEARLRPEPYTTQPRSALLLSSCIIPTIQWSCTNKLPMDVAEPDVRGTGDAGWHASALEANRRPG
ncbi:hypothetical protein pipiens_011320 [Culex pipiens pipiens]|uniref:Uncharacterized protein n=1 Tax=Culex pipiens pipiens TaxID=38569 RepID=A0ABD1D6T1_CULPP